MFSESYYAPNTGLGATVYWERLIIVKQSINKPSMKTAAVAYSR